MTLKQRVLKEYSGEAEEIPALLNAKKVSLYYFVVGVLFDGKIHYSDGSRNGVYTHVCVCVKI